MSISVRTGSFFFSLWSLLIMAWALLADHAKQQPCQRKTRVIRRLGERFDGIPNQFV
jgi:hypothetical protein